MTVFGDAEPEDAWQADDPIPVLIDNLRRRAAILAAITTSGAFDLERLVVRLYLLADHLALVGRRLEADDG